MSIEDALATTLPLGMLPRAWVVTDACEERGTVVFARNAMEARRLGHGMDDVGCMDEEVDLYVRRAPEFDECATSDALRRAQLDTGWWFECAHCLSLIDGDARYGGDDDVEIEPFVRHGDVYCSGWCAGAEAVRHVDARMRSWAALAWAVERFPGARILRVYPWRFGNRTETQRTLVPEVTLTLPPEHARVWRVQRGEQLLLTHEAGQREWGAYHAALGK